MDAQGNGMHQLSQVVEDEVEPRKLARSNAFKAPFNPYEYEDDGDEQDMDSGEGDIKPGKEPDLGEFFGLFPWLEEHSQIALCRTYANYLANKIKSRKP